MHKRLRMQCCRAHSCAASRWPPCRQKRTCCWTVLPPFCRSKHEAALMRGLPGSSHGAGPLSLTGRPRALSHCAR